MKCHYCKQEVRADEINATIREGTSDLTFHFPQCHNHWYEAEYLPNLYRRLLERVQLAGYVN